MGDLARPGLMWLKFWLFLVIGVMSGAIALTLFPSLRLAALLILTVWAFCRAYYFAFYVIEHYIDPGQRYSGIGDFVWRRWRRGIAAGAADVEPGAAMISRPADEDDAPQAAGE
ncbi:MAG: hypothetical protein AB8G96_03990 [Phycisphaerales bacterium]